MFKPLDLLIPALLITVPASAQIKQLRESPAASVGLDMGISNVKIDYHRPAVKGREIWGKLVPYGEAWRTGANEATTITFSDAMKVEGKDVPAGTYGFFAIPQKDKWTLILSKQNKIWGAFDYKQSEDVLRFDVIPTAAPDTEYLAYRLMPTSLDTAKVLLNWEKLQVAFTVTADVKGIYRKHLDEQLAKANAEDPKSWSAFLIGARYYDKENLDSAKALGFVESSIKLREGFANWETKARILQKAGKSVEAQSAMSKAIELAKKTPEASRPPKEYMDNLEKDLSSWKAKK
jgi:Protein of unknown function (DUF2911)